MRAAGLTDFAPTCLSEQVQLPSPGAGQAGGGAGPLRTCLAPLVGLINHHPLPHAVHFSRVDPETGCLR
jgi:hypothetical protein